MLTDETLKD